MHYTKERKKRRRNKKVRLMLSKCMLCLLGVLLLTVIWKGTSFAIRHLSGDTKALPEESEDISLQDLAENTQRTVSSAKIKADSPKDTDILLVNKEHPLDESYVPQLKKYRDYGVEVDASIYDALQKMLSDGEKEGLSFWIASGYRSMERQRELLDEDIEALVNRGYSYSEAYEEVVRETMPVGCSEHATGLAVDIVAKDYQILDERQGTTDEIKWLQKNCSQYGFILRYPKEKEEITKVAYESWHFRYVGADTAKAIMEQGITLEEYLEEDSL